jgi:hypothetical protein
VRVGVEAAAAEQVDTHLCPGRGEAGVAMKGHKTGA